MSNNTITVTSPAIVTVSVSQVGTQGLQGPQGPAGTSGADISTDANNGLTTGIDGGLYVTNAVDLGTFN